jgi:hypothetical protein
LRHAAISESVITGLISQPEAADCDATDGPAIFDAGCSAAAVDVDPGFPATERGAGCAAHSSTGRDQLAGIQ